MAMQVGDVKEALAEIAKQEVSTENVLKDMLADPNLTKSIATTVDARVQGTMDQKLV